MNTKKSKTSVKQSSVFLQICISVITSIVVSVVLTCIITNLLNKGKLEEKMLSVLTNGIRMFSVMVGCLVGVALSHRKQIMIAGVVSAAYILLLIMIGIILFEASFRKMGTGIISCVAGASAAIIIKSLQTKKRSIHKTFNR